MNEVKVSAREQFGAGGEEGRRRLLQRLFTVAFWGAAVPYCALYLVIFWQQPSFNLGVVWVILALIAGSLFYFSQTLKHRLDSTRLLIGMCVIQLHPLSSSLLLKGMIAANLSSMLGVLLLAALGLRNRQNIGLGAFVMAGVALAFINARYELLPAVELSATTTFFLSLAATIVIIPVFMYLLSRIVALYSSYGQYHEALNRRLLAVSRDVQDSSEGVTMVAREVSEAMVRLATSTAQQASAVNETAATMEVFSKAAQSSARNARQIVHGGKKTSEVSMRGTEAVKQASGLMTQIGADAGAIGSEAENLLQTLDEVGMVVSSVKEIAEQSKILAVNASIEAAKAGKYGVGFAVVAREVKGLAEQSKRATLRITNTIAGVHRAIQAMSTKVSTAGERVRQGIDVVEHAGVIVSGLSEAIIENSDLATVIATGVEQQNVGLEQISTAMEQISNAAHENQNISQQISAELARMSKSIQQLDELVGQMRNSE